MPFGFRARPRLGPFRLNLGRRGVRSISVSEGPFTLNSRRGLHVRLPGGLFWQQAPRRRQPRRGAAQPSVSQ